MDFFFNDDDDNDDDNDGVDDDSDDSYISNEPEAFLLISEELPAIRSNKSRLYLFLSASVS